jgi:hypothetical protein
VGWCSLVGNEIEEIRGDPAWRYGQPEGGYDRRSRRQSSSDDDGAAEGDPTAFRTATGKTTPRQAGADSNPDGSDDSAAEGSPAAFRRTQVVRQKN